MDQSSQSIRRKREVLKMPRAMILVNKARNQLTTYIHEHFRPQWQCKKHSLLMLSFQKKKVARIWGTDVHTWYATVGKNSLSWRRNFPPRRVSRPFIPTHESSLPEVLLTGHYKYRHALCQSPQCIKLLLFIPSMPNYPWQGASWQEEITDAQEEDPSGSPFFDKRLCSVPLTTQGYTGCFCTTWSGMTLSDTNSPSLRLGNLCKCIFLGRLSAGTLVFPRILPNTDSTERKRFLTYVFA